MQYERIISFLTVALAFVCCGATAPLRAEPVATADMASGTLPIVHINTKDFQPIVDKETKIDAGVWIEIPERCGSKDFALGSPEEPVALTIKGRGNSTWKNDKKPYKLKFDKKTSMLGMPKHKHFALLAAAHSCQFWMSQSVGMELARMIGLGWASRNEPIELVLNGEYLGMYFVYESVKIDENRLDIFEQEEENNDPETIPYGWLVELDNNDDPSQIHIPYGKGVFRLTHHSPEVLSEAQHDWIFGEFSEITSILTGEHPDNWVDKIDASSFAKYYIVRELMGDPDGFNGSMYMHRDKGEDAKWKMGPMWDCNFGSYDGKWILDDIPEWCSPKLLPEIARTSTFKEAFVKEWDAFYPKLGEVKDMMVKLARKCMEADQANKQRWEAAIPIGDGYAENYFSWLLTKAEWIEAHKNAPGSGINTPVAYPEGDPVRTVWYTLQGFEVVNPASSGVYLKVETYPSGQTRVTKTIGR